MLSKLQEQDIWAGLNSCLQRVWVSGLRKCSPDGTKCSFEACFEGGCPNFKNKTFELDSIHVFKGYGPVPDTHRHPTASIPPYIFVAWTVSFWDKSGRELHRIDHSCMALRPFWSFLNFLIIFWRETGTRVWTPKVIVPSGGEEFSPMKNRKRGHWPEKKGANPSETFHRFKMAPNEVEKWPLVTFQSVPPLK